MNAEILKLIEKFEEPGDFTYAATTDAAIEEAEHQLALTLPVEYRDFLEKFGHGGIGGIEIIGIGKTGVLLFVNETLKLRKYGLPNNLIVVENCDEWVYCIDSGDSSVVSWSSGKVESAYTSFDSYLMDRFTDAAENI